MVLVIETPRSVCTTLNFGAGECTNAAVSSLRVSRSYRTSGTLSGMTGGWSG